MFGDGNFVRMTASLAVPYKGLRKALRRIHFNHILFAASLTDEMWVGQQRLVHNWCEQALTCKRDQGRAASLNTLSMFPFHSCA